MTEGKNGKNGKNEGKCGDSRYSRSSRNNIESTNRAGRDRGIRVWMRQTAENLTDLLFPRRCPLCQRILTQKGELICEACAKELPYIKEPKCMICSRPIRDERKMLCGICENKVHYFIRGDCTFIYEGKLRDALMRLKFNNHREYADFFAAAVAAHAKAFLGEIHPQVLLPVPMNRKKRKERGFDQCALIGRKISERTGIPIQTDNLVRIRYTRAQKGLDAAARRANLRGAFRVRRPEQLPESVLVFDDIYTTGATLDEVSFTLRQCGIRQIYFICICSVLN